MNNLTELTIDQLKKLPRNKGYLTPEVENEIESRTKEISDLTALDYKQLTLELSRVMKLVEELGIGWLYTRHAMSYRKRIMGEMESRQEWAASHPWGMWTTSEFPGFEFEPLSQ